jgi:hypothetical protein
MDTCKITIGFYSRSSISVNLHCQRVRDNECVSNKNKPMVVGRNAMGMFSSWFLALVGMLPQSYSPGSHGNFRTWPGDEKRSQNRHHMQFYQAGCGVSLNLPEQLRQRDNAEVKVEARSPDQGVPLI